MQETIRTRLVYLLPLRLWVGLSFILAGENKLSKGDWGAQYADNVSGFVNANVENAFGFYQPFLESVVLPRPEMFAVLVTWGELLFGISIFLGLFTRLGAAIGIFVVLNYTFATGRGIWLPGMDAAYIWALFTLLLCGAGRSWGLDAFVRSRWSVKALT